MDGLARGSELVFVLCATNLPWELDMVGPGWWGRYGLAARGRRASGRLGAVAPGRRFCCAPRSASGTGFSRARIAAPCRALLRTALPSPLPQPGRICPAAAPPTPVRPSLSPPPRSPASPIPAQPRPQPLTPPLTHPRPPLQPPSRRCCGASRSASWCRCPTRRRGGPCLPRCWRAAPPLTCRPTAWPRRRRATGESAAPPPLRRTAPRRATHALAGTARGRRRLRRMHHAVPRHVTGRVPIGTWPSRAVLGPAPCPSSLPAC
jgi:hypothetical protein